MVVIIALVDWTGIARLTRAATLALRERDYVRSARASGGGAGYVMASHILPNVATPLIVAVTLTVGRVILFESVLSFLGFGIVAPTPSWGNMLNQACAAHAQKKCDAGAGLNEVADRGGHRVPEPVLQIDLGMDAVPHRGSPG